MRDDAFKVIRRVGVATGGSNIQFAVSPTTGERIVIEMNPRVSRSSALASKATGFPIAKIAALLAVGFTLDEIPNDITGKTFAAFEPTLDYTVVKIPRWAFEKFPGASTTLGTAMKSVGEVMAIGSTFKEALLKGHRLARARRRRRPRGARCRSGAAAAAHGDARTGSASTPSSRRCARVGRWTRSPGITHIDPWFLREMSEIVDLEAEVACWVLESLPVELLRRAKAMGVTDARLGAARRRHRSRRSPGSRKRAGVHRVFKRVDTCAAEFPAETPYLYSTFGGESEAEPSNRRKVMILGSGPNRIGQGIEFDYCCVHAAFALGKLGIETIMVNCNPETVSTDYDTSDRLYFEPLTLEHVLAVCETREARRRDRSARRADAAQARERARGGGHSDLGHLARRDRSRRGPQALRRAARRGGHPAARERHRADAPGGARGGAPARLPGARAPVLRARRAGHGDLLRRGDAGALHGPGGGGLGRAPGAPRSLPRGRHRVRPRPDRGRRAGGGLRHSRAHRGGRRPLRETRPRCCRRITPPPASSTRCAYVAMRLALRLGVAGTDERPVRPPSRRSLRARGQSARLAHRAVHRQGGRQCRWSASPAG